MFHTRAALYIKAEDTHDLKKQAAALTQEARNNGCSVSESRIYADLGGSTTGIYALLRDAKRHNFDVLYLNSTLVRVGSRNLAKQAVKAIYTIGLSVIAVSQPDFSDTASQNSRVFFRQK